MKIRTAVLLGLSFSLTGVPSNSQTVTWTKVWSTPGGSSPNTFYNGYHDIHYSSYIQRALIRSTSSTGGAESIFSSRLHFFNLATDNDTLIQDNGQTGNENCLPSTTTTPYTNHTVGQVWVDRIRHRLWMMEGVCQGFIVPEMWYYQLDSPISGHTDWVQVHPPHLPVSTAGGLHGLFNNASVVHDTDHDAFILFGYDGGDNTHAMQVYCETSIYGGVLTTAQVSVGCSNADDWTDITSQVTLNGSLPSGFYYPNDEYDTVHHKIIQFAGLHGCCTPENQTWTYDPVAKKWTNRNPANPPANSSANNEGGRVAHAFDSTNGKYYYHLTARTPSTIGTAPSRPPEDWVYDAGTNTWTHLSTGKGPSLAETMTYAPAPCNCLIAWAAQVDSDTHYFATGIAEIWVAHFDELGTSTSTTLAADVNPATFGKTVQFTAAVTTNPSRSSIPAGSMSFFDGDTFLENVALDNAGQASFQTSSLTAGVHSITASYVPSPSAGFAASTSTALTETINAGLDFTIGPAAGDLTSATVKAGQTAMYTLQLSLVGGAAPGQLMLTVSCMGAPSKATCSGPASQVTVTQATPAIVNIGVSTTANGLIIPPTPSSRLRTTWNLLPILWVLPMLLLLLWLRRFKQAEASAWATRSAFAPSVLLLAMLGGTMSGCGGGGVSTTPLPPSANNGTPAGTYTLTVTVATSTNLTHTEQLTLTVQ